jgi:hypothetical protein
LCPNLGLITGLVDGVRRRTGQSNATGRLTDALFRPD